MCMNNEFGKAWVVMHLSVCVFRFQGVNAGMLPFLKRPALVDAKSGLPVYRQIAAASSAYPQAPTFSAVQFQKPQYVPITSRFRNAVIP